MISNDVAKRSAHPMTCHSISAAAKRGYYLGGEVVPGQGSRSESAFFSSQRCCSERPGAVKGAPLLAAAERAIDGDDSSEMIAGEGEGGAKGWRNVVRQNGTLARRL